MGKKSVLLVDDDPAFLECLKVALEVWGYDVILAKDGEEALARFRMRVPDFVFSDMIMPRLGGLELLRRVKRERPATIVVIFTAYARVPEAVAAIREGAADLLTKPVNFGRLQALLESLESREAGQGASSTKLLPANSGARPPESDL